MRNFLTSANTKFFKQLHKHALPMRRAHENDKLILFPSGMPAISELKTRTSYSPGAFTTSSIQPTFSEKLWISSLPTPEKTLSTCFINGIASGNLDPNAYGKYTVQDAIFCYHDTKNLYILLNKETNPKYREFLLNRIKSYEAYTKQMFLDWQIKNPDGIWLGAAAKSYVDFLTAVATTQNTLYALVTMLPCEMLWPWIAKKIDNGQSSNLYYFWITGNESAGPGAIETFINQQAEFIEFPLAAQIYQNAMNGEFNFFASPCKEPTKTIKLVSALTTTAAEPIRAKM